MTQVTIWHNPRCSKSRQALALLQDISGIEITVFEYLKEALTVPLLAQLKATLGIASILEIARTGEADYKAYIKDKALSEDGLLLLFVQYAPSCKR